MTSHRRQSDVISTSCACCDAEIDEAMSRKAVRLLSSKQSILRRRFNDLDEKGHGTFVFNTCICVAPAQLCLHCSHKPPNEFPV